MANHINESFYGNISTWRQMQWTYAASQNINYEKICPVSIDSLQHTNNNTGNPLDNSIHAWGIDGRSSAAGYTAWQCADIPAGNNTALFSAKVFSSNSKIVGAYFSVPNLTFYDLYTYDFKNSGSSFIKSANALFTNRMINTSGAYTGDVWTVGSININQNIITSNSTNTSDIATYRETINYSTKDSLLFSYNYKKYIYKPVVQLIRKGVQFYDALVTKTIDELASYVDNYSNPDNLYVIGFGLIPYAEYSTGHRTSSNTTSYPAPQLIPNTNNCNVPFTDRQRLEFEQLSNKESVNTLGSRTGMLVFGKGCNNTELGYTTSSGLNIPNQFEKYPSNIEGGSFDSFVPLRDNVSCTIYDCCYKASPYKWQFNDVSYHWDVCLAYTPNFVAIAGETTPHSLSYYQISTHPVLCIDDDMGTTKGSALVNAILHECAFTGLPIAMPGGNPLTDLWDSQYIALPEFDEHVITTGKYRTTGKDILPNYSWENVYDNDYINNNYNPNYEPNWDIEPETDSGDLTNTYKNRFDTTTNKQYVMSIQELRSLQSYLNGNLIPDNPSDIANFAGSNPQEYIVSIQMYPFTLPKSPAKENIFIGCVDTNIESYTLATSNWTSQITGTNDIVTYDFGTIDIPKYGDFRDYECNIILQLPFIGSYELDPKIWTGQRIGLRYIIDFNTGKISAVLKRTNLNCNIDIECYSGNISITIPFFASNMGQYQSSLASIEYAIEQSKIKQISSAIGGFTSMGSSFINENPISGINSIVGAASSIVSSNSQQQYAQYQLEHTKPHVSSISVASPLNAFYMDDRARIIITKPVFMQGYDANIYAHTVGYACCYQSTVSAESGFIVCSNIRCNNIPATVDEIKAIKDAFSAGVIV